MRRSENNLTGYEAKMNLEQLNNYKSVSLNRRNNRNHNSIGSMATLTLPKNTALQDFQMAPTSTRVSFSNSHMFSPKKHDG